MRELPQLGPLLVPTLVDIILASAGHWFAGLLRLGLLVSLILVPVWVWHSKPAADVSSPSPSHFSKYMSLEASPYRVQARPAKPGGTRPMFTKSAPTGGPVQASADAAPRPGND